MVSSDLGSEIVNDVKSDGCFIVSRKIFLSILGVWAVEVESLESRIWILIEKMLNAHKLCDSLDCYSLTLK